MPTYIALLRKDPGSDFGVDFPDFPGCVTAGTTLAEAREMAVEALEFHIDGLIEDGDRVPQASSLEVIMADPGNAEAIPFPVTVRASTRPRYVRVNVTIPEPELRRIDAHAKRHGLSRSTFLTKAARRMMGAGEADHAA